MRGRVKAEAAAAAAAASFCCWAARSVEGLRKSLMSWSSEGGLGLGCEAAANSLVFSKILVFQRLLENSLLPAS
jgi:predicted transcriptional regulator